MNAKFKIDDKKICVNNLKAEPALFSEIKELQSVDDHLVSLIAKCRNGEQSEYHIRDDGILCYRNRVCVPNNLDLKGKILSEAHQSKYTVHPGNTKMYRNLRSTFWWNGMKSDIASFVSKCPTCQQVKAEHQRPAGLLQPLPVPEWKWEHITMDFVVGLPRTKNQHDAVWVIVDRLTKSVHFLPMKMTDPLEKLARLYIHEIVRLHGVPVSIVSDRDSRFVSHFWRSLQMAMGTVLNFSTSFHPQSDGQSERTIQTLEDMLRACVMDFKGSWDDHVPLIEFAYNNSFHSTIGMAPFEALYGRKCRSPICWDEVGERKLIGPKLIHDTVDKVKLIRERIKTAQSRQKSYADNRRRELEFEKGDFVFVKVSPSKGIMQFDRKGKLSPRFIGPFEIVDRVGTVAYRLALPPQLSPVHNVFHISMLRKYQPDPSHVLDYQPIDIQENMTYIERPVRVLDKKEQVLRTKSIPLVKVLWQYHGIEEATWEREDEIRERYPDLFDN